MGAPDVLFDLTPYDTFSRYRGVGVYVRELANALDALDEREREGLDVRALVDLDGDHPVASLAFPGADRVLVDESREIAWLNARRTTLVRTLRTIAPRLFHATQPLGTPRGSFVPRVVTCLDVLRLVLHREYLPGRPVYRRLLFAAEAARFHGARRVLAISQHTADDLVRLLHVPAAKIDVVPLGVDAKRFRPAKDERERDDRARVREGLGIRAPYVLYVGAADPRKDVDVLVRAWAKARLDGAELVLAGRLVDSQKKRVEAAIDEVGRPPSIRLLGFVPDEALVPLLDGAIALAYPSRYEGFGLPVLEAMSAGCPVVTTRATSLAEVAGDAALTFPVGDAEALAIALRRMTTETSLRAELRRAGLARAERFSWRNAALGTIASYVRALRG